MQKAFIIIACILVAFGIGYFIGIASDDAELERAERSAGAYQLAAEQNERDLVNLRSTLDGARDRSDRVVRGIESATIRASKIADRGARIAALVDALRVAAREIRSIAESSE